MQVHVTIVLGPGEYAGNLTGNSEELAAKVLAEVGGDPSKDVCHLVINDSGSAGVSVPPIEIEPPPVEPPPTTTTANSTFATNNAAPPSDKQTRTNAAAASDTTAIYIDNESTEGDDLSALLLMLIPGDSFEIRGVNDTTKFSAFTLSAMPIQQSSYVELPVTFVDSNGTLQTGPCTLTYLARS